jgi:hypothetical protein
MQQRNQTETKNGIAVVGTLLCAWCGGICVVNRSLLRGKSMPPALASAKVLIPRPSTPIQVRSLQTCDLNHSMCDLNHSMNDTTTARISRSRTERALGNTSGTQVGLVYLCRACSSPFSSLQPRIKCFVRESQSACRTRGMQR